MNVKPISPLEWKTLLGFAVALAVLLVIGVMAIRFLRQTRAENRLVEHSYFVIESLEACLLTDREMETYARAYVLTGQDEYLRLYHAGVANLGNSLDAVQRLTLDNRSQQNRVLTRLRPLVDERLRIADQVIEARRNAGQQAAIAVLFQHDVLSVISDIRHVIGEMQADERGLLMIRMTSHAESSRKLQSIIVSGTGAAIVFLFIASLLIHQDLRMRQRAEEDLRESQVRLQRQADELIAANRELESFSYSVSHDLRAPLRGIEGFTQLILEQYKDRLDPTAREYFNRISAAARRMGVLIDEILDLSRITRLPLKMQDVDLAALARVISEDLQKGDASRKADWIIPARLPVRGDMTLLNVALSNLLSNAWKFTGKRARATIELGKAIQQGKPAYFVRDNGAGFDMAYQSKLFEAFQRLHSPSEFPGIGIGLATVQRVVHRHGGRIWAEGVVDQGAVFHFTLG